MLIQIAISIAVFLTATLLAWLCLPLFLGKYHKYQIRRTEKTAAKLDDLFIVPNQERLFIMLTVSPFIAGFITFLIFNNFLFVLASIILSFVAPSVVIKMLDKTRKMKFKSQIIDAFLIISSSLKAGLTLIQSIGVLVEESQPPIRDEFSLLLKENKMGVSIEASLEHMVKRMQSEEIDMLVNTISFVHSTGGNFAELIDKLVATIREKNKIEQMVQTLTLQGKLQGRIMSLMPILFAGVITSMHKDYFKAMLDDEIGRALIIGAIVLQVVGLVLLNRLSKVEV